MTSLYMLNGLGPSNIGELEVYGVTTVEELAKKVEVDSNDRLKRFRQQALLFVHREESKKLKEEEDYEFKHSIVINGYNTKSANDVTDKYGINIGTIVDDQDSKHQGSVVDAHFMEDHSWFEHSIEIPYTPTGHPEEYDMVDNAVIYDLRVENNGRISFVVGWSEGEKMIYDTFTPLFILHFNHALPPLYLQITTGDWNKLGDVRHLLHRTFWESNMIIQRNLWAKSCTGISEIDHEPVQKEYFDGL